MNTTYLCYGRISLWSLTILTPWVPDAGRIIAFSKSHSKNRCFQIAHSSYGTNIIFAHTFDKPLIRNNIVSRLWQSADELRRKKPMPDCRAWETVLFDVADLSAKCILNTIAY